MVESRLALTARLYQNIRRAKKYGRYPEESACRLTKKAIRRSEECACWPDCLLPGHEDESRLEAVPLVKNSGRAYRHLPNLYDELVYRYVTNFVVARTRMSLEQRSP
jgi:hypothetical protein